MSAYNGISWFPKPIDVNTAILLVSDASDIAVAGVCKNAWTVLPFTGEKSWLKQKSIQYQELYAAVLSQYQHSPNTLGIAK